MAVALFFARPALAWLLLLAAGTVNCGHGRESAASNGGGMVVKQARLYVNGAVTAINLADGVDERLGGAVRTLVATDGSVLRLAVTPERMQGYRQSGSCLEIELEKAVTFPYMGGSRSFVASRLFLIWGGDLVGEATESLVVVHGNPEYSAGPLKYPVGRTRFVDFLKDLPKIKPRASST